MAELDKDTAQILDEIVKAGEILADKVTSVQFRNSADYLVRTLCACFFARSLRTFKAFIVLVRSGYTREAECFTRMNLETLVDWHYIGHAPEERARQFFDYIEASRCRRLSSIDTLVDKCGFDLMPIPEETRQAIAAARKQFLEKYELKEFPPSWSGKSLEYRAKKVMPQVVYERVYRPQSELIHGGPGCLDSYLDLTDPDIIALKAYPEWESITRVVKEGCLIMISILEIANDSLELSSEAIWKDVSERFACI